jgi:hypothetical protein
VAVAVAIPVAPPPAPKWYEKAKIEGFVDAYASMNFNMPKPQTGTNIGRAFDVSNGFGFHWAGLNASYAPDPVGGFVALRFGPGAVIYNGVDGGVPGLANVKEAYASWKPGGGPVQLDFGKFSTWIGAEVADSQYNMTYTRSALFFTQPAVHTGLRLDYLISDQLDLKLYLVNGWNNSLDNNRGKTIGATIGILPTKDYAIYVNYIGGPEQSDVAVVGTPPMTTLESVADANSRWRHLVDVIADLHFDKARVLINGDFGTEKISDALTNTWYGANLTLGYAINDQFAVAARGGYTADSKGNNIAAAWLADPAFKAKVVDASLTLAAMPTPNLIIKLEPRIDSISSDAPGFEGVYPKAPGETPPTSKTMFTTTLGVVVTTN